MTTRQFKWFKNWKSKISISYIKLNNGDFYECYDANVEFHNNDTIEIKPYGILENSVFIDRKDVKKILYHIKKSSNVFERNLEALLEFYIEHGLEKEANTVRNKLEK